MPSDPPIAERVSNLARELSSSPDGAAAVAALGALLHGCASRSGLARTLTTCTLGGIAVRRLVADLGVLEREIRNAGDAALAAAWLGRLAPAPGTWAIEPDFARLVVSAIRRPAKTIVELGSGTTTLLIARQLEQRGEGRLYSVEHDADFAAETQAVLEADGTASRVQLIVAPLRRQQFGPEHLDWYDADVVRDAVPARIDSLIVDGPPSTALWARWPAMSVLFDSLSPEGVVLLDDGRRRAETETAMRWSDEHPTVALSWVDTVKGSWMLEMNGGARRTDGIPALTRMRRRFNPHPRGFGRWPVVR